MKATLEDVVLPWNCRYPFVLERKAFEYKSRNLRRIRLLYTEMLIELTGTAGFVSNLDIRD